MERDEILRLAREAGCYTSHGLTDPPVLKFVGFRPEQLERFAVLVAAAERAKLPPAPLIVDASNIDCEALAEAIKSMKHARQVLVASAPRPDEIDSAVAAQRCAECGYQHGHAIGCANNPVDASIRARGGQGEDHQHE